MMGRFFWERAEEAAYEAFYVTHVRIAIEIDDVQYLGALVKET